MNNEYIDKLKAYGITPADYDDAGNRTKVKTSTGIWFVVYNAENRPISFTNTDSGTIVECTYDYMGRRATKKVTVNGSVTLHQRYLYRGYLQIACCDLTRSNHPCLWLITWDPSQPVATRPLAIQKDGTWYTYGWDLTKNICEVYGQHGYIRTNYTYAPYGEVTISGDVTQPIQWSSEYSDSEIGLVYYNYRYYSYFTGSWLSRDPIGFSQGHLYSYVGNTVHITDYIGLIFFAKEVAIQVTLDVSDTANGIQIEKRNFQGIIDAADDNVWCWQCISEMTVMIHGLPNMSLIEQRKNDFTDAYIISPVNAKALFEAFKREEDFCSKCTIYWLSCLTGLGHLPQVIADTTGCTVYAPNGMAYSGSEHDPLNSRVCKRYDSNTGTCVEFYETTNEAFSVFFPTSK